MSLVILIICRYLKIIFKRIFQTHTEKAFDLLNRVCQHAKYNYVEIKAKDMTKLFTLTLANKHGERSSTLIKC